MLPFIIAGMASGSIFGLAGIGLVLTYKTSGLLNFAHGAVATVSAYVFYELHGIHRMPWPVAAVLSVTIGGMLFGLFLERLATALVRRSTVAQVTGTVGLLLAIQGVAAARYGTAVRAFPPFLPVSTFEVFGIEVGWDQLITAVFAGGMATGLYVLLQRTRTGAAMRAVVDDAPLTALAGINPKKVRRLAWVLGSVVSATSGLLIAPELGLDAILLTLLVIQAFGAAAVGRFDGLITTYLGGLTLGVAGAVSAKYAVDVPWLAGLRPSLPFIVLFAAMVVRPPKAAGVPTNRPDRSVGQRGQPLALASTGAIAGIALPLLLIVPWIVGDDLYAYTKAATFVILFLSLGLLIRTSGQVSLAHAAFAGVGAATFSHVTTDWGVPWLPALAITGLLAVPIASIIAVPAIRLSGIYLALATMGFSLLMQYLVFGQDFMFGTVGNLPVPRPAFGGQPLDDRGFYFVVIAVLVAVTTLIITVQRSRLGRILRSMADSPTALGSLGVNTRVPLVLVFCISGFLAAIAGALLGAATGTISTNGFSVFDSLTWIVVLAIVGRSVVPSAFVGAALFVILPLYGPTAFAEHQTLIFGAVAMIGAVASERPPWLRARLSSAAITAEARARRRINRAGTMHPALEAQP